MANPWQFWNATTIARITGCPAGAVTLNFPLIADALERRGIYERDVCLGLLPTVAIETASTLEPIDEFPDHRRYPTTGGYPPHYEGGPDFHGRGYVQLTHLSNYRAASAVVGRDLVADPSLANDPMIAAEILAWWFATKGVPAKDGSRFYTLVDLCREHDWEWVRRAVQGGTAGLDRLVAMASALDAYTMPGETPVPTYNLNLPIRVQDNDWDCAQEAAMWALQACGRTPDDDWMERAMLAAGVESTEVGLTRGDGSLLAEWITREYAEPGANGSPAVKVHNVATVGFDDVRSIAGTCPVLIGGHNWGSAGHWVGVRRFDGERLILANPAGSGPTYGQQSLDRQQFNQRGPWSMVVVQAEGAQAPAPTPPVPPVADPRDAQIAALSERVGGLEIAVAHLADILAGDRLIAVADEARSIREQFLGKRPAA